MYQVLRVNKQKGFSAKREAKGFTLVELMVAIAIVAVLASVSFALFQNTQASARDAKRRADIDAVSSSLETHFNSEAGTYPLVDVTWFSDKAIPTDPLNVTNADDAKDYRYYGIPAAAVTTYTVCAHLEKNGGNFSDKGVTSASGDTADYYCKLSQQQ